MQSNLDILQGASSQSQRENVQLVAVSERGQRDVGILEKINANRYDVSSCRVGCSMSLPFLSINSKDMLMSPDDPQLQRRIRTSFLSTIEDSFGG